MHLLQSGILLIHTGTQEAWDEYILCQLKNRSLNVLVYIFDPCSMYTAQEINLFAISHMAMSLYNIILIYYVSSYIYIHKI